MAAPISKEEIDAMIEDYYAGMTYEEIEDKYGRSNRIQATLRKHGLKPRPPGPRANDYSAIWKDHQAGMTVEQLRRKYGYTKASTVYSILKRLREAKA